MDDLKWSKEESTSMDRGIIAAAIIVIVEVVAAILIN